MILWPRERALNRPAATGAPAKAPLNRAFQGHPVFMSTKPSTRWTPFEADADAPIGIGLPPPEETPIVVVDDELAVLSLLEKALSREGYPVEAFGSGPEALERLAKGGVALLITDIRMPEMDGIELSRLALEEDPDLAILVLTGAADTDTAVESLRLGVRDYLTKPITIDDLNESVSRALRRRGQELYRRKLEAWLRAEVERRTAEVRSKSRELERVSVAMLSALVRAMEAKDPRLKGHSERVGEFSEAMGKKLGLGARLVDQLRTAGLLHDIGMIAIPESLVLSTGQLSPDDFRTIQQHPEVGANILKPLTHIEKAVEFVRCHHERVNGSGYPRGLKGSDVPLGAQVVGLAEMFVSMTENRAHRPACSELDALAALRESQGIWFEPRVFAALEGVLNERKRPKK